MEIILQKTAFLAKKDQKDGKKNQKLAKNW